MRILFLDLIWILLLLGILPEIIGDVGDIYEIIYLVGFHREFFPFKVDVEVLGWGFYFCIGGLLAKLVFPRWVRVGHMSGLRDSASC